MTIHYHIIGAAPVFDQYRNTLPKLIARWKEKRGYADELIIAGCAAHFYGLFFAEFNSTAALVDAIEAAEQDLRFS